MKANALGIIFSNMHDESLQELTEGRTMASVPFGGRYRLIDFVLSNMYNSGITKAGVITKSNYQSLIDHLGSGKEWDLSHKREGLYILPPFGRSQSGIYKSRIDALNGIRDFIHRSAYENVIMSDCDEICNMDFNEPLNFHIMNNADITAVYKKRNRQKDCSKNTVAYTADSSGRVNRLAINPETDEELNAGINIWVVRKTFLERIVADAVSRGVESWERGVLMSGLKDFRIYCWEFDGYTGNIGSMYNYFRANMDLLNKDVKDDLFYRHGHIYTKVRDEPPAKYGASASVSNSLVADGCIIEGEVENSILFRGVHIGKGAKIKNSVLMQSTRIETGVQLNYVITDKNVYIKNNRVLMGYSTYPLFISKGSVV